MEHANKRKAFPSATLSTQIAYWTAHGTTL